MHFYGSNNNNNNNNTYYYISFLVALSCEYGGSKTASAAYIFLSRESQLT